VKVIGYVRVSTAEQAEHGYSLDAQDVKLRRYCELYDLELARIERDEGESAGTLNRPALQRALADLRAGRVDALLVVKLDRLTRSIGDLAALLKRYFQKRSLLSVEEKIDTSTAGGRMMLNVLTSVAEWERDVIGERTRAGKQQVRVMGRWVGGEVEYGHALEVDPTRPPNEKGTPRMRMIACEPERLVASRIKALAKAGLSLRAISSTLAEDGVMARCGRPWSPQAIAGVIARGA
jgi:DNA invertase Pin-like site-specific DNA recombinase